VSAIISRNQAQQALRLIHNAFHLAGAAPAIEAVSSEVKF